MGYFSQAEYRKAAGLLPEPEQDPIYDNIRLGSVLTGVTVEVKLEEGCDIVVVAEVPEVIA